MNIKRLFIAIVLFLILLVLSYFISRNTFLRYVFSKAQTKIFTTYNCNLSASKISFSGLDGILIEHISLQPVNADTLLQIERVQLNLALTDLFKGEIGFNNLEIYKAHITVFNDSIRNNINFTKQLNAEEKTIRSIRNKSFLDRALNIQKKLLRLLQTSFKASDVFLSYKQENTTQNIHIPEIKFDKKVIEGSFKNLKNNDLFTLKGTVLQKNKEFKIALTHTGNAENYVPFFDTDSSLKCNFKSISATLLFENISDTFKIKTSFKTSDFSVNHWRIAGQDVQVNQASFIGNIKITDSGVTLDNTSGLLINNVKCNLFAEYKKIKATTFALNLEMPEIAADSFFNALPTGMFNTLKGISCAGTLAYKLNFFIDTENPDSLLFTSEMKRKNLRLNHFGNENLAAINASFPYAAFDKDRYVRTIQIGLENPLFTPLNQISPYLPKAVMQSEDPSFMLHNGFLMESFRESIIKNYKERRFARGGSTISMQLVKNVFLNRNKTIARKVEEALLVYLIENLNIVSKERMLEVYLNIIEWGPNVYGIGEASSFYFAKKPAQLTLQESIFLAGIIPRPKAFMYQFDKTGNMKPYLSDYFRILTQRMAFKGWITPIDTTGLLPNVKLHGPAIRYILPADSFSIDTD